MQLVNSKVAQSKPGPFGFKSALDGQCSVRHECQTVRLKKPSGGQSQQQIHAIGLVPRAKDSCLSLPPSRQDLTQGKMTRRSIIVGIRRWEGRKRAEARALCDYAGRQPTQCNVGLMSLAGYGPSMHGCLIID